MAECGFGTGELGGGQTRQRGRSKHRLCLIECQRERNGMTSLASLTRTMVIRRVALFSCHVIGASVGCRCGFLRRCGVMMRVEMPRSPRMVSVSSYIFCSVGKVTLRLRRHLYGHLCRHHVTRQAAQWQQGDHEGEEKNTHQLMIGQSAKKFPSL